MRKLHIIIYFALLFFTSCEKFLSERSSNTVSSIESLKDMQALLDGSQLINVTGYSPLVETGSDDYFIGRGGFERATDYLRANYLWKKEHVYTLEADNVDWMNTFRVIATMNTILDELPWTTETAGFNPEHIKGAALFHRAYAYYNLVQIYCLAYDPATAKTDLGLPLRSSSDIDLPNYRASLEDTFNFIENDIKQSIHLLPTYSAYVTRPSKAAAHAFLAKFYLYLERYAEAGVEAERSLTLHSELIDYNELDGTLRNPIEEGNIETLYYAQASGSLLFLASRESYVDTILYDSYADIDLRKEIFFESENNGYHTFHGTYYGYSSSGVFNGLTVSEVFLIKAEILAREERIIESLEVLNELLLNRYERATFEPRTANGSEELLKVVLEERRKELVFRGVRWSDLKRLNRDPRFAKTLYRRDPVSGALHELPPNDLRYAFLIPESIIERSGLEQNPR